MRLIKPSAEILNVTLLPLQLIEEAGRTCYKSGDKITSGSHRSFAQMLIKRGHESVLEHASATVRFICDRGVSHEIVRHRLASYSQESTRYCDYNGGHVAFVIPPWCEDVHPGAYEYHYAHVGASQPWFTAVQVAEQAYQDLRAAGWRPEQARSVLPNSLKTELVMTANLREWRHFFRLRCSAAAHPQMREVTLPLLGLMQAEVPIVFDNLMEVPA